MSNYLMKFKGTYRLLPELDAYTNDFPRDANGNIDEDTGIYIGCQYGNRISYWGLNQSRRAILTAYIPSLQRGRNIKKAMNKMKVPYFDYDESSCEVMFKFPASDIDTVAELLKARTSGANISPFSTKNLPKNKEIVIPEEDIAKYKNITSQVDKKDMLLFKKLNSEFIDNIMQRQIRKRTKNRSYNAREDMKMMKLGRQVKEFIWYKGMWQEYIDFLSKEIKKYYDEN